MTLRTWLLFFIISMAFSAEVLAWALQNGQFSHVNRGRGMALRREPTPWPAPRPRPWWLAAMLVVFGILIVSWGSTLVWLVHQSY